MKLIRGWERQYAPDVTGGLRLSQARRFHDIGEEEGLGDRREGEVRVAYEGSARIEWEDPSIINSDEWVVIEGTNDEIADDLRQRIATETDDPNVEIESTGPDEFAIKQNVKVGDSSLDSPFLFCLAREPATISAWERLRAALPDRYDTWTITEDVASLKFEIECGIKRWLGLNWITEHRLQWQQGWVTYPHDEIPQSIAPDSAPEELLKMQRWFRKRRKYKGQEEYRLAWLLSTPQWETLPDVMDIELTRTGLTLFRPWTPPDQ